MNVVERYSPASGTWSAAAPLLIRNSTMGLVAASGRLWSIGGSPSWAWLPERHGQRPYRRREPGGGAMRHGLKLWIALLAPVGILASGCTATAASVTRGLGCWWVPRDSRRRHPPRLRPRRAPRRPLPGQVPGRSRRRSTVPSCRPRRSWLVPRCNRDEAAGQRLGRGQWRSTSRRLASRGRAGCGHRSGGRPGQVHVPGPQAVESSTASGLARAGDLQVTIESAMAAQALEGIVADVEFAVGPQSSGDPVRRRASLPVRVGSRHGAMGKPPARSRPSSCRRERRQRQRTSLRRRGCDDCGGCHHPDGCDAGGQHRQPRDQPVAGHPRGARGHGERDLQRHSRSRLASPFTPGHRPCRPRGGDHGRDGLSGPWAGLQLRPRGLQYLGDGGLVRPCLRRTRRTRTW